MAHHPRMLRNLGRILLAVAVSMTAAIVFASPSSAAVRCLGGPSWYVFHHGETANGNVVVPIAGPRYAAVRDASFEPTSQYLFVCEDSSYGWGVVRLYSNTSKLWLGNDWPNPAVESLIQTNLSHDSVYGLFYLCDLDGNWLSLRHLTSGLYVAKNQYNQLSLTPHGGGGSLYRTTPSLNHLMPRC